MLLSDFSRKAHANFQNYIFVCTVFFQHIDVKLTSISCKIEVHVESNLHFSVSIYVFNHFKATNIQIRLFKVCKYNVIAPHISSLMQVKRRYPIL